MKTTVKDVIQIVPDSEAEMFFIKVLMPVCKDKVICRLGVLFGWNYNEYEVTRNDSKRIANYVKSKKGKTAYENFEKDLEKSVEQI